MINGFLDVNHLRISESNTFENEVAIFEQLGLHERILHCHGLHPALKALCFDYLPQGDVGHYLAHSGTDNIPYSARPQWILGVAEGIAFLHSKGVARVDSLKHASHR